MCCVCKRPDIPIYTKRSGMCKSCYERARAGKPPRPDKTVNRDHLCCTCHLRPVLNKHECKVCYEWRKHHGSARPPDRPVHRGLLPEEIQARALLREPKPERPKSTKPEQAAIAPPVPAPAPAPVPRPSGYEVKPGPVLTCRRCGRVGTYIDYVDRRKVAKCRLCHQACPMV